MKRWDFFCLFIVIFLLNACKLGYDLDEDGSSNDENSRLFHGPSNGAHWELRLDDDNDFRLRKYSAANTSSSEYTVNGTYDTLSSGFLRLTISGARPDDIDDNNLHALELADHSLVFFPFADNEDDLLALIPELESCPSSSRGNTFFLERSADTLTADNYWVSELRYSFSANEAVLSEGLDPQTLTAFSEQTRSSSDCESGYAQHSDGTNYLSSDAAILEYANVEPDGSYERLLSVERQSITDVNAMDSLDYVGFLRKQAEPDDTQFVSARCSAGECTLYDETDADNIEQSTELYTLTLTNDEINLNSTPGIASGQLSAAASTDTFNAVCVLNSDLDDSTDTIKVMACHSLDPDDSNAVITFIVADSG